MNKLFRELENMFHTKWFEQFHCNSNVKLNERMKKKRCIFAKERNLLYYTALYKLPSNRSIKGKVCNEIYIFLKSW